MIRTKRQSTDTDKAAPAPETWTIRYTAIIEGAEPSVWDVESNWHSKDRAKAAETILLMQKVGQYGLCNGNTFYPPHRIREITWEIIE
jgi:hypothetical protein